MESFESALLPVLPLNGMVVFPSAVTPLFVMREDSLAAVQASLKADKRIFLTMQRNEEAAEPSRENVFDVGCVAEILQVLRVPDGAAKILVEGLYTARAVDFVEDTDPLQALLVRMDIRGVEPSAARAYMRTTLSLFEAHAQLSERIPEDLLVSIRNLDEPLALVHAVANYAEIRKAEKQLILESSAIEEKFMLLNQNLEKENQILELEDQIVSQVRSRVGRSQRDHFLNEQLKVIERELGISGDEHSELEELREDIDKCGMPAEAKARANKELQRLERMPPLSPEATVARTYIEWLVEVPWTQRSGDEIDLAHAREILDEDHYGLDRAKERIVEYLAVTKLAGRVKGPIVCLVGPPGVGKTSLARSIARCCGREFVRLSLGGVRDEAEIRGHRRTYVGALPGKILQGMKKAGTVNPVFLLDEVDKMSSDFRGDPAAALLEVLDPEQNREFNDHYLDVDYDLSQVMFLTTANTTAGIPPALEDRMEVIRISGYTDLEKVEIGRRHLIPKSVKASGLRRRDVRFTKKGLVHLIQRYTRESGVRSLEREIQRVCRKLATRVVSAKDRNKTAKLPAVDEKLLRELLGPEPIRDLVLDRSPEIGNAVGLAWTEAGGEVLTVEVRIMPGKGDLHLTGKLGDVMKESAKTALSFLRANAQKLGLDPDFYKSRDVHVHLPEGAIPKDGPSAGITLATSLASALSGRPVRQDIAMTGELTLRGRILKVGGLKEKALAAYRYRIAHVLIPRDNLPELEELPEELARKIIFHPVDKLEQVLEIALVPAARATRRVPSAKKPRTRHRAVAPPPG